MAIESHDIKVALITGITFTLATLFIRATTKEEVSSGKKV